MTALGGWLFRHRGWVPVPLLVATVWFSQPPGGLLFLGMALLGAGELLRIMAVRHIGSRSRTREAEVGPLVTTGPYAHSRNPLYVGNILLWAGLGALSGQEVGVMALPAILGAHYGLIVLWEEAQLESRWGTAYRAYQQTVPRWIGRARQKSTAESLLNWGDALLSERSTLAVLTISCTMVLVRGVLFG